MLSNSSKYAIKAVLYLALNSNENNKVMVKDICAPINVPQAYIAKLLQLLSKENLISSTRGPSGGFYLNDNNRKQSIMSIVNVIDGEKKFNSCMLSLKECDDEKPCPMHKIAHPYLSKLLNRLNEKTIEDLSIEIRSGESFLPL